MFSGLLSQDSKLTSLLQAYILISSSSVQLQLENSQEFGWPGTSHILMAHTRAPGGNWQPPPPIRITWVNGSSCPVEIWRMFPRTLALQAERTTNDNDKSKINKQQDIWYNTKILPLFCNNFKWCIMYKNIESLCYTLATNIIL